MAGSGSIFWVVNMSIHKAVKFDDDKVNIVRGAIQRFPLALREIAKVSALGSRKYNLPPDDSDFMKVEDGFGRYTDALGRHLTAEKIDGPINVEYGGALPQVGVKVLHAAQVAWNALARLEIYLRDQNAKALVAADMSVREGAGHDTAPAAHPKYEDQVYPNLSKDTFVPHVCGVGTSNNRKVD